MRNWAEESKRIDQAVVYLREVVGERKLQAALIAGSGLEALSDALTDVIRVPFAVIPHMKAASVQGHAGELKIGYFAGQPLIVVSGRLHYYEGHSMAEVTFLIRALARLGVKVLVLTNAAGGINSNFSPGSMMLINDHINLMHENPLRGPWQEQDGLRFPDMHNAYDAQLRLRMQEIAQMQNLELHEGVYAALSGPNYETPAEIRMLRILGADAVGMSTVPEVIVARQCGVRVLGISHIANPAAGLGGGSITHEEVMQAGRAAAVKTMGLLQELFRSSL